MDDARERKLAREALLADRNAAQLRRQRQRLVLRLPRDLPAPDVDVRPGVRRAAP